ncbi:cation:proton antiporter [Mycobacterium sp. OTB74]|uniref:cation:proton antiporter n=1 Tax=Mycobacterium sp. OTB74 TaxID=1853452 RepID=UPI0024731C14|nr:cation:proton antiporter [Mycobacterium sp. OTB74]MDH6243592.1 NhaP-type Na+/H+ or K+/H+ antiporter [Mycobacterium sp. OTB74]
MAASVFAVIAGLVLVYSLLAKRLTTANITGPMFSMTAGIAVFSLIGPGMNGATLHIIAELTLVIVLFHDASTVKLAQLRREPGIAVRLLVIGFPLALVATFLLTRELLPTLGIAGAWLLAAAVTPTDAGLGAPTILNPVVPVRVRRNLNVESGLNDGLATPIVLLALSVLAAKEGVTEPTILEVSIMPVVAALICAVGVGLASAWLMDRSRRRSLSSHRGRAIATLAVPLLLFGLAELVGANAFIASFVGGLVFGAASVTLDEEPETTQLLEVASDLMGFVVWFFAGAVLLLVLENGFHWQWLALAVAALTVLRLVPVFIALLGTGYKWPTVAFVGWFGPRGLATIVFGLLSQEELGRGSPVIGTVGGVIMFTVLLSVFAHGISAAPLATRYGQWVTGAHPPIEGHPSVEPLPSRGRGGH